MSFAIESQGGTNPLSAQGVLRTLMLAASSSQQQVQAGTEQLQNWEKQEMYHSFLQVAFQSSVLQITNSHNSRHRMFSLITPFQMKSAILQSFS